MDVKKKIGDKIKERREELGLSYRGLAVRTGVSHSSIFKIENVEDSGVSLSTLTKLNKVLKFTTKELIELMEEQNK